MRVHNKTELKALIKEAIQNGSIYERFDNLTVLSHSGSHIADVLIEQSGMVILRSHPVEGKTDFEEIGNANQ